MKIIAAIDRSNFLVQATDDELARIMGYQYRSALPDVARLDIGAELKISEIYDAYLQVRDIGQTLAEAVERHARLVASVKKVHAAILPTADAIKRKLPK
jgi:hypothetical protein